MLYVLLILNLQNTYVLFNGLLQFLVYSKEKDAILFTYMPEVFICIYNEINVLMIDYVFVHLTYVLLETCVMMLMTSEDIYSWQWGGETNHNNTVSWHLLGEFKYWS